jgi:hypothetical protein
MLSETNAATRPRRRENLSCTMNSQWNVLNGSGKFYEKLGKHLVNDEVSRALKLFTQP